MQRSTTLLIFWSFWFFFNFLSTLISAETMLAEPRRRAKWTLNPRGTLWANDDNKLGQRMLEKLGWTRGSGLGRTQQGATEPIRTESNMENKGLGYKKSSDDEWIGHQDAFGQALKALQKQHAVVEVEQEEKREEEKKKSLENESKKSRKRIHYHKFTRGKDLSLYRPEDLESILGSKAVAKKSKTDEDCTVLATKNEHAIEPAKKSSGGLVTIDRGSLHDYFAKKAKALNKGNNVGKKDNNESKKDSNDTLESKKQEEFVDLTKSDESKKDKTTKKKKKKKESKAKEIENTGNENHHYDLRDHKEVNTEVKSKSKKSKKESKNFNKSVENDKITLLIEPEREKEVENKEVGVKKMKKKSNKDKSAANEMCEEHHYDLRDHHVENNGVETRKLDNEEKERTKDKKKGKKMKKNKENAKIADDEVTLIETKDNPHYDLRDNDFSSVSKKKTKSLKQEEKDKKSEAKKKDKSLNTNKNEVEVIEGVKDAKKKTKNSKAQKSQSNLNDSVEVIEVLHHDLRNRDVEYTDDAKKTSKKKRKASNNDVNSDELSSSKKKAKLSEGNNELKKKKKKKKAAESSS